MSDPIKSDAKQAGANDSDENLENKNHRTIRSFVIRASRMSDSQRQARTDLWPQWGLELEDGLLDFQTVFSREAPIVFEIGFGMGDSLATMAQNEPDKNFVGIEVHPPGIGNLLKLIKEKNITNLRIYDTDVIEVLTQCIPPQTIDRVQIYFPDPWPKKRHHKRRLIQPKFLELLKPRMKSSSVLHVATDWQDYAEQTLELLNNTENLVNSDPSGFVPRPEYRPLTKFEKRGIGLGYSIYDLVFLLRQARSN
ncbi:MAG: tRNA (guanosine(46)-N7)-methyltransferase TrmB [Pseudomonadales bacterium]|nr:tRNA (guanosine(46)-N7)-methyltransferase TrmB [Pseudomonadales bacterium]